MIKCPIKNFRSISLLVIISAIVPSAYGQWVSNPETNTKIVKDLLNPTNLSAVTDGNGGGFIFWQDTKDYGLNRVYYLHFNSDAKVSFRADGKRISVAKGEQVNPVVKYANDGTSIVLWLGEDSKGKKNLYVQKLSANGNLLWSDKGVRVTNTRDDVSDYSLEVDYMGNVYVSYLAKEPGFLGDYKVMLKKIFSVGKADSADVIIHQSNNRMSTTKVVIDKENGLFVFWMENLKGKSVLMTQHVTAEFKENGNQGLLVSITNKSVENYSVQLFGLDNVYVCWQYQNSKKEVHQNLISDNLSSLWNKNQFLVTEKYSVKKDVRLLLDEDRLWVGWTSDSSGTRSANIKAFDKGGSTVKFKSNGLNVIKFRNGYNPQVISDSNNGVIMCWYSNRSDSVSVGIYAQRISFNGKMLWAKEGIAVSTSSNSIKSNVSIIPDRNNGAIFVFLDKRENKPGIYAQRIFNNGIYVSHIVGFNALLEEDTVKISWYAANETDSSYYIMERMNPEDTSNYNWSVMDTIFNSGKNQLASYKYYDTPGNGGTIYYRLIHKDLFGNSQLSEVARVNYINSSTRIIVAQNEPNPFSDSTRITFYLPEEAIVNVEFFNSQIQKVHEIEKQKFSAGKHEILFYTIGLEPGIYFYRFASKNYVYVKKMVITKK